MLLQSDSLCNSTTNRNISWWLESSSAANVYPVYRQTHSEKILRTLYFSQITDLSGVTNILIQQAQAETNLVPKPRCFCCKTDLFIALNTLVIQIEMLFRCCVAAEMNNITTSEKKQFIFKELEQKRNSKYYVDQI